MLIPNLVNYPFTPPFSLVTVSSFSKSVNLFLFYKEVHLCHFSLDSRCKYQVVSFLSGSCLIIEKIRMTD